MCAVLIYELSVANGRCTGSIQSAISGVNNTQGVSGSIRITVQQCDILHGSNWTNHCTELRYVDISCCLKDTLTGTPAVLPAQTYNITSSFLGIDSYLLIGIFFFACSLGLSPVLYYLIPFYNFIHNQILNIPIFCMSRRVLL